MALNHCLIIWKVRLLAGPAHGLVLGLNERVCVEGRVVPGVEQVLSSWELLVFLHSAGTYWCL